MRPPGAKDKCPVCGMFVAKYPDWAAVVRFRDGTIAWFDGCKDLFSYYLNLGKFNPAQSPDSIRAIQVKDYYGLKSIDGRKAFYVPGSDVYGPMGKELIPFEKEADAKEFLHDHKGKRVLRFNEITPAIMKALE
jgi:nitrous oxide reductase accessory protein NosL